MDLQLLDLLRFMGFVLHFDDRHFEFGSSKCIKHLKSFVFLRLSVFQPPLQVDQLPLMDLEFLSVHGVLRCDPLQSGSTRWCKLDVLVRTDSFSCWAWLLSVNQAKAGLMGLTASLIVLSACWAFTLR